MLSVSYLESVYYVVFSYLTLGYGDVVPFIALSRALAIPFIYIGIVLGGLVLIGIFQAILESARGKNLNASTQRGSLEVWNKWREAEQKGSLHKNDEEFFHEMRALVKSLHLMNFMLRATLAFILLLFSGS